MSRFSTTMHRGRLMFLVGVMLTGTLLVSSTSSARAVGDPGQFFDGPVRYSTITNCASIIFGSPYTESGAGAYVGGFADPDESPPAPAVNQAFYVHLVVWGLGNSCSGQYFVPALQLPANVSFATDQPILCFTAAGQAGGSDCPQWSNVGAFPYAEGAQGYYSTDNARGGVWPLPQGRFWEFRFPVRSSAALTAVNLQGYAKMLDGNASPVLAPSGPVTVFGAQGSPSILYGAPSTVATPTMPDQAATTFGVMSEATVTTQGTPGQVLVQLGTRSGEYDPDVARLALDGSHTSWRVWTDWNEPEFARLVPGRRYFWRMGFDPGARGGGDAVFGKEQTFRALWSPTCGGRPVTVSTGLGQLPTTGDDVILGTTGADRIYGAAGDDRICGGEGDDRLDGGLGDDVVSGGRGNDTLVATTGNDTVSGGPGTDTVSYADAADGVLVSLATTAAQETVGAGQDRIATVERLVGGIGDDRLTGNGAANRIDGGPGDDVVSGGKGKDTLVATTGDDTVRGGSGTDTVTYAGSTLGVKVSLAATARQDTVGAGRDAVTSVENLTGGKGADRLTGSPLANRIDGGAGRDRCYGGAGRDTSTRCEYRRSIP